MKTQVTFGHLVMVIIGIIIPVIIWGANVERRFEQVITNTEDVQEMKKEVRQLQATTNENYIKILEKLNDIELQLKDKKDR